MKTRINHLDRLTKISVTETIFASNTIAWKPGFSEKGSKSGLGISLYCGRGRKVHQPSAGLVLTIPKSPIRHFS